MPAKVISRIKAPLDLFGRELGSDGAIEQLASIRSAPFPWMPCRRPIAGIPGTPMALAPAAYVLFNEVLRYDPGQPLWPNRDRFVLSCGHASMLLYSALHLAA